MGSSSTTTSKANASFLGSAAIVMSAFVLSRVLGLVRDSIWGSAFGTSADMDAFRAASTVTDTLYYLVAGGALGSAFIPTFTAYLARGERKVGWRVASAVVNLVFLVTLATLHKAHAGGTGMLVFGPLPENGLKNIAQNPDLVAARVTDGVAFEVRVRIPFSFPPTVL